MPLILRIDVGPTAFARLMRDGCTEPVAPGAARPADIPESPADRAAAVAPWIPAHTVLTGLAGLWVWDGRLRPATADAVGSRGLHRPKPGNAPPGWTVRCHSGRAATEKATSFGAAAQAVRVAGPARCAADALRWAALEEAIPAVLARVHLAPDGEAELTANATALHAATPRLAREDVRTVVRGDDPRGAGYARAASAWSAIESALRASE